MTHESSSVESIVFAIRQGSPEGEEQLYSLLSHGMRFMAYRKVGRDQGDDCFHEAFMKLVVQIRGGALREPAALLSYARTILDREIASYFHSQRQIQKDIDFDVVASTAPDSAPRPDTVYESDSRTRIMRECLQKLRPRERDILVRYYLHGQESETICKEMHLSSTQYRLLKSRSKQRLEERVRQCTVSSRRAIPSLTTLSFTN